MYHAAFHASCYSLNISLRCSPHGSLTLLETTEIPLGYYSLGNISFRIIMQCWRWSPSPPGLPSLFNSSSSLFAANILPIAAPLEESLPHSVPLTPIPPTPLFPSLSVAHFYLACRFVFSTPSSTASCNNIAPSLFAEAKVVSFLVSFAILRVSWLRECVYVLKWQEFFFASVICERFCIGSGVVVPRIGVRWIGRAVTRGLRIWICVCGIFIGFVS